MKDEVTQREVQHSWAEDEADAVKRKEAELERRSKEAEEQRLQQQLEGEERARRCACGLIAAKLRVGVVA